MPFVPFVNSVSCWGGYTELQYTYYHQVITMKRYTDPSAGPKRWAQITRFGLALITPFILLIWLHAALAADGPNPSVYWQQSNTGLSNLDIEALVTTPTSPAVLYAGTWGGGVFRSSNNGATWLAVTAGLTLPMYNRGGLAVNPVTPTILFAGDYYGWLAGGSVYRSTDGGDSWTVSLAGVGIETLLVHPLSPTLVLTGTVEDGL